MTACALMCPAFAKGQRFRLLPAITIIIGRKSDLSSIVTAYASVALFPLRIQPRGHTFRMLLKNCIVFLHHTTVLF